MRKSKFLTVCFGACFGAGQMYLGMHKKGVAIMGGTAALGFFAALMNLPEVLIFLPVIWCYAFFDACNSHALTMEERKIKDDAFIQRMTQFFEKKELKGLVEKRHLVIGWGCIAIGAYILFGRVISMFVNLFDNWVLNSFVWRIHYDVPRFVFAAAAIIVGLKLVKGTFGKEGTHTDGSCE
ncbi:MAG: hypothetical protein E7256_00455 [Lachnospiraceae bacterium]|nr:hypothetical protein [Lachnospiraceae bacterium]